MKVVRYTKKGKPINAHRWTYDNGRPADCCLACGITRNFYQLQRKKPKCIGGYV